MNGEIPMVCSHLGASSPQDWSRQQAKRDRRIDWILGTLVAVLLLAALAFGQQPTSTFVDVNPIVRLFARAASPTKRFDDSRIWTVAGYPAQRSSVGGNADYTAPGGERAFFLKDPATVETFVGLATANHLASGIFYGGVTLRFTEYGCQGCPNNRAMRPWDPAGFKPGSPEDLPSGGVLLDGVEVTGWDCDHLPAHLEAEIGRNPGKWFFDVQLLPGVPATRVDAANLGRFFCGAVANAEAGILRKYFAPGTTNVAVQRHMAKAAIVMLNAAEFGVLDSADANVFMVTLEQVWLPFLEAWPGTVTFTYASPNDQMFPTIPAGKRVWQGNEGAILVGAWDKLAKALAKIHHPLAPRVDAVVRRHAQYVTDAIVKAGDGFPYMEWLDGPTGTSAPSSLPFAGRSVNIYSGQAATHEFDTWAYYALRIAQIRYGIATAKEKADGLLAFKRAHVANYSPMNPWTQLGDYDQVWFVEPDGSFPSLVP